MISLIPYLYLEYNTGIKLIIIVYILKAFHSVSCMSSTYQKHLKECIITIVDIVSKLLPYRQLQSTD